MTAPTQAPPRPEGAPPRRGRRATVVDRRWAWSVVLAVVADVDLDLQRGGPQGQPRLGRRPGLGRAGRGHLRRHPGASIDERSRAGRAPGRAAERADAIDESTDDLEAMLADLRDPLPEPAADRAVVEPWLADWAQLLEDRRTYADAVRVNPDARFLTDEKFNDPLDRVVADLRRGERDASPAPPPATSASASTCEPTGPPPGPGGPAGGCWRRRRGHRGRRRR